MSFDERQYEQIASYINNEMNEAEKTAFEALLKNDAALASFVDICTSLDSVYNEHAWNIKSTASVATIKALANEFRSDDVTALSKKIRDIQKQHTSTSTSTTKRKKTYFYLISSAVAIAAILTLFYFTFMQSMTATDAFEEYHNWKTLPSFVEKGNTEDERVKAQKLFEAEKYQEALAVFKKYSENTTFDPKLQVYIGVCYLELENYDKALETFDGLLHSKTIDQHKAYWYKALTYLKRDDLKNARKVLNTLVQDTSNYNYEKARELLKKLK